VSLLAICLALAHRKPDLEIGGSENPYLRRWYIIPRNRLCNIYLHQFLRDDDDRALHDHPWPNCSLLLSGRYMEMQFEKPPLHGEPLPALQVKYRRPWRLVFRRAKTAHRVVLFREAPDGKAAGAAPRPIPSWSLFFTGANLRSWGFWCPAGRWIHWRSFTAGPKGETVGAGCGDPVAHQAKQAS
jgi:hypothetical protein